MFDGEDLIGHWRVSTDPTATFDEMRLLPESEWPQEEVKRDDLDDAAKDEIKNAIVTAFTGLHTSKILPEVVPQIEAIPTLQMLLRQTKRRIKAFLTKFDRLHLLENQPTNMADQCAQL